MRVVVGLGNPGRKYERTRHNIGWMLIDTLAKKYSLECKAVSRFRAEVVRARFIDGTSVLLVKPTTFMNCSGVALGLILAYYDIAVEDVLVVVDDVSLEFSRMRFRAKGSAGGHNGLKSVTTHLKTDAYSRLRLGVGEKGETDMVSHVIGRFHKEEEAALPDVLSKTATAVECWATDGTAMCMNKYNSTSF